MGKRLNWDIFPPAVVVFSLLDVHIVNTERKRVHPHSM
jgi:hypothetical protein